MTRSSTSRVFCHSIVLLGLVSTSSCSRSRDPAERVLHDLAKYHSLRLVEKGLDKLATMGPDAIDSAVEFYRRYKWRPWGRKREAARMVPELLCRVRDRKSLPKLMELAKERDRLLSLCAVYGIRGMAAQRDVVHIIRLIDNADFRWHDRLIEVLGRLGGEEARKALLRYVKDPRGRVRRGAYLGLRALGDASVIAEVRKKFQEEKNPQLRIAAAETLASLGDEAGSTHLVTVLEGKSPDYLLVTAAYASGRVKERAAVPGLVKLLGHTEWYYRDVAREALTMIGTDEARKAIKQHLPEREREMPLSTEYNFFYSYDRDPFMDWDWEFED